MYQDADYVPPKVWTWKKPSGGTFANINRPVAGATFEKALPVGRHPLQLYSQGTPNGVKITIMLEELLALGYDGAEYDAWLIDIFKGDQFGSGFTGLNPNSKVPAMIDHSGAEPIKVFESGSILFYLAEKFGALLPRELARRTEVLNWLFWQVGSAPYVGGGFGHFYVYAPFKIEYAIDRFTMEVKRQLDVLDRRLADREYVAGPDYSIADIAILPWHGGLVQGWAYEVVDFISGHEYRNVLRWADTLMARPRCSGDGASTAGVRMFREGSTSDTMLATSMRRIREADDQSLMIPLRSRHSYERRSADAVRTQRSLSRSR